MIPSFLTPYLLWIKLAGVALLVAGSAYVGHYVTSAADDRTLAAVKLADSQKATASVTASLGQLQGFISKMDAAGGDYTAALASIKTDFDQLKKDLTNATLKPLPVDCRPDAGRLRVLAGAVAAANAHSTPAK